MITNTSATNVGRANDLSLSRDAPYKAEGIALCSAFILTFVFVVAGNSITIILFAMNRSLRKKQLFLPINMAIADLLLGAVTLPIYIYHVGFSFQLWTSRIGDLDTNMSLSIFRMILDTTFSQASLISAAFISYERFHAIIWPFKPGTFSTRVYGIVICTAWIVALLVSAISAGTYVLQLHEYVMYFWVPYAFILMCIICGCNIGILIKFHGEGASPPQLNRDSETNRNKRLTKTLLFVSCLALMAWLPLIIANAVQFWFFHLQQTVYHLLNLFNYSNSFISPVVYVLRIAEFRQALKRSCFRGQPAMNNLLNKRRKYRLRHSMTHYRHEMTSRQRDPMHTKLYTTTV